MYHTHTRSFFPLPHCSYFSNVDQALDVKYAGNTGYLRRASTSPTTDADLTLPSPGSSGSLSDFASIVLDTTAPRVESINTSLANSSYGVGQEVTLLVTFTAPVGVNG